MDSGTSWILMPEANFDEFYDQVKQVAGERCDLDFWYDQITCNDDDGLLEKLPELRFVIDNKEYRIPASSLFQSY